MEGTQEAGYVSGLLPEALIHLSEGALGSRAEVEAEIDAMLTAVRAFWSLEPDQVMRAAAAYSARCTELSVHLLRVETTNKTYSRIRTLQVGKLIEELERQYRTASRLVELRRQDLDLARGM